MLPVRQQPQELVRDPELSVVKRSEIHRIAFRFRRVGIFRLVDTAFPGCPRNLCEIGVHNFGCFYKRLYPRRDRFGGLIQHRLARRHQISPVLEDVSLVRFPAQHVLDTRLHALRRVLIESELLSDRVRRYEPDPVNIISEAIRVFRDHADRIVPVGLIDLRSVTRADIVRLEEQHDVLNLALCLPRRFDDRHPFLPDAGNPRQLIRGVLDYIHRIHPEFPDDQRRHLRTDAFD